jgi:hypothetical protein
LDMKAGYIFQTTAVNSNQGARVIYMSGWMAVSTSDERSDRRGPRGVGSTRGVETMICGNCNNENEANSKFCSTCGLSLNGVLVEVQSRQEHIVIRGSGAIAVSRPEKMAVGKSRGTAAVLSLLIVGAGQLYNDDTKKGVVMFLAAVLCGAFTWGFGWAVVAIWSAYDAWQIASGKSARW